MASGISQHGITGLSGDEFTSVGFLRAVAEIVKVIGDSVRDLYQSLFKALNKIKIMKLSDLICLIHSLPSCLVARCLDALINKYDHLGAYLYNLHKFTLLTKN